MSWHTNTAILARLETFSAETAWSSLADHFERPLTRYALRSGLAQEAVEDVVQETLVAFARAYRDGSYDRARGRLSSWLFGIAQREVASARRKAARSPMAEPDAVQLDETPDQNDGLERIWEEEWRRSIIERCTARVRSELEPATWECFALQVFEGLSADEVAARKGVPRQQVYNAKHRVARRLRELAQEYEDA